MKLPSRIFSSDFFVEELSDLMKLSHGANVDTMSLISNCEDLWKSVRDLPHLLLSKNLSNHEVSVLRSFNMSPPIFDMKQFEIDGSEIWLASFGSACSTILNLEVVTIELDSFSQQSVQLDLGERISCMGIQFPMIQHLEFVNDTVFIIIQSSETDSTFATMWKIDLPSIRYHFIGNSPISSTITKAIYCERYSNLGSFQATFIALSESRNLCAIGKNNNRICILDLA